MTTYDEGDALDSTWPASSTRVQERFTKLTHNDVKSIDGHSEYLVSRLQERYGYSRERAEQECQALLDELESSRTMPSGNARAPGSPTPQSGTSRGNPSGFKPALKSNSQGGASRG